METLKNVGLKKVKVIYSVEDVDFDNGTSQTKVFEAIIAWKNYYKFCNDLVSKSDGERNYAIITAYVIESHNIIRGY